MTADATFREVIGTGSSGSVIARYYRGVRLASARLERHSVRGFNPPFHYPELTDTWERFFGAATAAWHPMGTHDGVPLALLSQTTSAGTSPTSTIAALLMVARAVEHIRTTGDAIMIFAPSSISTAAALRDSVARALELGLADPDELRVTTLSPRDSVHEFGRNLLTESSELRRLNPILVYPGTDRAAAGVLGRRLIGRATVDGRRPCRLWHSQDSASFRIAAACQAFFEYETAPPGGRRLHAYPVSTGNELLGYQYGHQILSDAGLPVVWPGFLVVQQLASWDVVRHLLTHGLGVPGSARYADDPATGLLTQRSSPHLPQHTWSERETLVPGLCARLPSSAEAVTRSIVTHGGNGIVVSLHECLSRYGEVQRHLAAGRSALPADPRELNEWSLPLVMTGILNALDRGLLPDFDEVVAHGAVTHPGTRPVPVGENHVVVVSGVDEMLAAITGVGIRPRSLTTFF